MSVASPHRDAVPSGASAQARSPFARLADLLANIEPGQNPINLSVGEPRHAMPDFVAPIIARHIAEFARYPLARGIPPFREAAAAWLTRRFGLARPVDPEREVLVLNGSREGLFYAAHAARHFVPRGSTLPAILMPNPFYPAYAAAAEAAGCEVVLLPTLPSNGFLPDLDTLSPTLLARSVAFYLASPSNPQGAVADRAYCARLVKLAAQFGFMIFADECYSEIYGDTPPVSMLAMAGADFANVVVFQSLSKRSNLPGLRVGFCAGDARFIAAFHELRNVAAPQVPVPAQHVAAEAYRDEGHVERNRALYRAKFDVADAILGGRFGYRRPQGGFCLWLDVSAVCDDETAARRLWRDAGVRVVPGSYLARTDASGVNPGRGFIRAALVHDLDTTRDALLRIVATMRSP